MSALRPIPMEAGVGFGGNRYLNFEPRCSPTRFEPTLRRVFDAREGWGTLRYLRTQPMVEDNTPAYLKTMGKGGSRRVKSSLDTQGVLEWREARQPSPLLSNYKAGGRSPGHFRNILEQPVARTSPYRPRNHPDLVSGRGGLPALLPRIREQDKQPVHDIE